MTSTSIMSNGFYRIRLQGRRPLSPFSFTSPVANKIIARHASCFRRSALFFSGAVLSSVAAAFLIQLNCNCPYFSAKACAAASACFASGSLFIAVYYYSALHLIKRFHSELNESNAIQQALSYLSKRTIVLLCTTIGAIACNAAGVRFFFLSFPGHPAPSFAIITVICFFSGVFLVTIGLLVLQFAREYGDAMTLELNLAAGLDSSFTME